MINRVLMIAKYAICYFISLVFSAICFYLSFSFISSGKILSGLAATFMTYVFYTAAEASEIILAFLIGNFNDCE
jgi:hypothetical protein